MEVVHPGQPLPPGRGDVILVRALAKVAHSQLLPLLDVSYGPEFTAIAGFPGFSGGSPNFKCLKLDLQSGAARVWGTRMINQGYCKVEVFSNGVVHEDCNSNNYILGFFSRRRRI